jgi:hypothetical protein
MHEIIFAVSILWVDHWPLVFFYGRRVVVYSTNIALARAASSSKLSGCYIISGSEISCRSHLTSSRVRHVGTILFMK